MRNYLVFAVALLSLVSSAYSKGIADLSPEEFERYNQSRIWVVAAEDWRAYQGDQLLSEVELFEILGLAEDARKAGSFHQRSENMMLLGVMAVVSGAAVATLGMLVAHEPAYDAVILGGTAATTGLVSIISSRTRSHYAPLYYAEEVVAAYNARLLETL